ncbi:MAG TPA: thiamine-phosphate kinase [Candidatus Dormibacteraeota bacterium]|nr:thiamine-phosphate kinase [Candidatus Dormibacteraeota bacterium]
MIEDQIIDRIVKRIGRQAPRRSRRASPDLILGIGDDAAIVRPRAGADWVLSSDFSLEDVHFRRSYPPEAIGYRSLARAVSDLGAMGAHPEFFLLSISLPSERTGPWLDRFLAGMASASRRYSLQLIGGDTTRWAKVAIAITVIGRAACHRAIRRDGARAGDRLYVSGQLGAAALGLAVLRQKKRTGSMRFAVGSRCPKILRQHLYPAIPIELGIHLAEGKIASAMIDLSDGLSTDLARLARASRVGARVFLDRLPAVPVPAPLARGGLDAIDLALNGGEDYGLLFTVPARRAARVPGSFRGVPITCIGEIVPGRGVKLVGSDGRERRLAAAGWDPFRQKR